MWSPVAGDHQAVRAAEPAQAAAADTASGASVGRMRQRLSAAVVVCTASQEREPLLRACVDSLLAGTKAPDEIFVVVDQNRLLEQKLAGRLPAAATLLRTERQGNSEGRNVGIQAATSDVVAFVDDDATVETDWLVSLMEPFETSDHVLGVGGAVVPEWDGDRRWLPDELLWVVGCTYRGHRENPGPIRNPIGCNMAFRRDELVAAGGFATEFGKRGNALVICDETELGLRLERAHGHGRIHYVPTACVRHVVPATRVGWKALVRRSITEGLSKGRLQRLYPGAAVSAERRYVRRLVTEAVPRLLVEGVVRRDRRTALGAAAILVSLLATGAAFVARLAAAGYSVPHGGTPR
jgi:cellulose synthase/poly-beta-1,6-N-acetylglucosamine synthase-like glycosyltransferase